MEQLIPLLLIYIVFLGALMSPGPDLMITLRNALGYSSRAGVFTAIGIGAGLVVHMSYCVAGIGVLITQSAILFNLVKYIGAGYLVFIGVQALRSKGIKTETIRSENLTKNLSAPEKTDRTAFVNGFVTNLFNPKATMFFLALFSQMLDPSLSLAAMLAFCAVCIITACLWFSFVSLLMSARPLRLLYARASKWIDRVFGGFFIFVGVKLAMTRMS